LRLINDFSLRSVKNWRNSTTLSYCPYHQLLYLLERTSGTTEREVEWTREPFWKLWRSEQSSSVYIKNQSSISQHTAWSLYRRHLITDLWNTQGTWATQLGGGRHLERKKRNGNGKTKDKVGWGIENLARSNIQGNFTSKLWVATVWRHKSRWSALASD
jgi:hypothetical protein